MDSRIPMIDVDAVVPKGEYCYTINKVTEQGIETRHCPFLGYNPEKDDQDNGFCSFTGLKDWEDGTMLWDSLKECGVNTHPCGLAE